MTVCVSKNLFGDFSVLARSVVLLCAAAVGIISSQTYCGDIVSIEDDEIDWPVGLWVIRENFAQKYILACAFRSNHLEAPQTFVESSE